MSELPSMRGRPVITPSGEFPNLNEAAHFHGLTRSTASYRAYHCTHGWKWADDVDPNRPFAAVAAFKDQRKTAGARDIPFNFTFEEWWAWWQIDNRWDRRGDGPDDFVMARNNDTGPYQADNVYCTTKRGNVLDISSETRIKAASKALDTRKIRNESRTIMTHEGQRSSAAIAAIEFGLTTQEAIHLCDTRAGGWRWMDEHENIDVQMHIDTFMRTAHRGGAHHRSRKVETPAGVFDTLSEAARFYGISQPAASGRIKRGSTGWGWLT